MSEIDPADPTTWEAPNWGPEWDGEWEFARLKSLALRLLDASADHSVALGVFEEGYVKLDVFRNGQKQGEIYVNRGMEGAEASYEVFLGDDEDHYTTEEEAVRRILSGLERWREGVESARSRKVSGA